MGPGGAAPGPIATGIRLDRISRRYALAATLALAAAPAAAAIPGPSPDAELLELEKRLNEAVAAEHAALEHYVRLETEVQRRCPPDPRERLEEALEREGRSPADVRKVKLSKAEKAKQKA